MKSIYIVTIILILLLSAFFRLGFIDSCRWGGDEDSSACKLLSYFNTHSLPPFFSEAHGIKTIGIINFWFYLVMTFFRDPRVITLVAIGIPNTIAVILCFLFCFRFIDKRTAIVSSALFGFSNWAIIYSRNLWGVDLLQLISILVFYILTQGINKSSLSIIILSLLFLPFLYSFHLTGLSIFVSILLILAIYFLYKLKQRYLSRPCKGRGLLVFIFTSIILCLALFFFFRMHRKLDIITEYLSGGSVLATLDLLVRGKWYYTYLWILPKYPSLDNFSDISIRIIFIFGCVYLIKKIIEDIRLKRISVYSIVGIWYFVFMSAFLFTDLTTHAHYFMVVLPCLFIIASIGFFSIIDYFLGKNKIEHWELLLLFLIFTIWSPWISILLMLMSFFAKKIIGRNTVNVLYSLIVFILFFYAFSNIQLFIDIERRGKVHGRACMDLGAKVNTAKFVINDAQKKFKETGLRSYYSIMDDGGYSYIFGYLTTDSKDFISYDKISNGYHYTIVGDIDNFGNQDILEKCLFYKRIGRKLVIVERINEI